MSVLTPERVEQRLVNLSKEIDHAHDDLVQAEARYHKAKSAYELGMARVRLSFSDSDTKLRVQKIEDLALTTNADAFIELNDAEAMVKAARGNAIRLRMQVDITRSVGTSVRASMEV